MDIGAAIFLIAVGAIMAFAVEARVGWLDLDAAGWVLMIAGVIGLILTLTVLRRRRRVVRSEAVPERRMFEDRTIEYDSDRPL